MAGADRADDLLKPELWAQMEKARLALLKRLELAELA
jgi:hypothetical protein